MEDKNMVGSMDAFDFLNRIETCVDRIVSRHFNDHIIVFSNKPILGENKVKNTSVTDIKSICWILGISRQTLNNWENKTTIGNLLSPFILKNGSKKYYDPYGIMLTIFENPEKFGHNYFSKFVEISASAKENREKNFKIVLDRIENDKIVSYDEYRFYLSECWLRKITPLDQKRYHQ